MVRAATFGSTPKAFSTRLGLSDPDEQALPAETQKPWASSFISITAAERRSLATANMWLHWLPTAISSPQP